MFNVTIRTTPVTKEEIDAYMLSGKGNPREIIGYLRSIIRQYVTAKTGIGCVDVEYKTAWANLQKVLGDNVEINKTIVVNLKYKGYTAYIGRYSRKWRNPPDAENKFANIYQIGPDGTRDDVIAKHKKDFYENPELQEAVWNELKGETLGCFCKPLTCHGDTYVEYIENRERQNNETSQDRV